MTVQELQALKLPIDATEETALYVEVAIDWLKANTTLEINKDKLKDSVAALPAGAKLFICRYFEIMSANDTVASESIAGMSQTFKTDSKNSLLYAFASETIGAYLKGQVSSIPNVSKWV